MTESLVPDCRVADCWRPGSYRDGYCRDCFEKLQTRLLRRRITEVPIAKIHAKAVIRDKNQ